MKKLIYFVLFLAFAFGLIYAQETTSIADTNASEPKFFAGCKPSYHYSATGFMIGYLPWKIETRINFDYEKRFASDSVTSDEDCFASLSLSREILHWQRNRIKSNLSLGLGCNIPLSVTQYEYWDEGNGNLFCKLGFEYIINESFGLEISNNSILSLSYFKYYDAYELQFHLISSSLYIKYYF